MARSMMMPILVSIIATTMLFEFALGADHTVGGSGGWDPSTDLATWVSGETFTVGDNLVFTYTPNHNVLEVSKDDYKSCSTSGPVSSNSASPTTIKLTDAGSRYFVCGTPGHCAQGMKVEIKTVAASSGSPPTTTTPPSSGSPPTTTTPPSSVSPAPPVSTTSPPSSGTHTPPSPKPSSAATVKMSVVSMVGIGFLMTM